jgi:hypothetical protein
VPELVPVVPDLSPELPELELSAAVGVKLLELLLPVP